jgi:hypothetical protein
LIGLGTSERIADMVARYLVGQSLSQIALYHRCSTTTVEDFLRDFGGIRRRPPSFYPRTRKTQEG